MLDEKIDYLDAMRNDIKIAVDEIFDELGFMLYDLKRLKLITFKPDKTAAQDLLEYLNQNDQLPQKNSEKIVKNLDIYLSWLELYCQENNCSKDNALKNIINS